jgi:FtsZ-binding cell division protein ZapB
VVRLEKFENLEKGVNDLVDRFSLLQREKDRLESGYSKKTGEHQLSQERLERLYRERYQIRAKLDELIKKLENLEEAG